jgi:Ca2+-binding RTX toxin-like protein
MGSAVVMVNLSQASTQQITVDYSTLDDTALEEDDYTAVAGTLIFEAGQTRKSINIPINGDNIKESNESFMLFLSSPVNATLNEPSDVLVTILDDDAIIRGTAGPDTLIGTTGNDTLDGLAGNDRLLAQAGNDVLIGGLGRDLLAGGTGSDVFDFNDVLDSGITSTTRDQIGDFKTTKRDKIDLSTIDANTGIAGDQAFTYIGALAFSAPGQIRFNPQERVLYGSNDADTAPEFSILLSGVKTLASADFVL